MQNAAAYRARAREQMGGNIFANNWLIALVACLLYSIILSVSASFIFGAFLLEGICLYGMAHVFLSVARGRRSAYELRELTVGIDHVGDLLVLSLIKNIFQFLWALIPIVGIVKYYAYAMTYYIKYDHPEYDWRAAITESRRMMNGHKWELFCLQFSFIGWIIVGALCFGVGMLWVTPYMRVAEANFYDDLKRLEGEAYEIPFVNENPIA